MILFAIHATIAVILAYILIRAVVESKRADLVVPIAGIATLFIIHCITFRESCLECSLKDPHCVGEIVTFWFLAGWAVVAAAKKKKKKIGKKVSS